jgi:hypothetical protein
MVSTSHVTVVVVLPVTVPVNVCAWPVVSPARTGLTLTATLPVTVAVIVKVDVADFVVSVTDVAFRLTAAGVGTLPGAV